MIVPEVIAVKPAGLGWRLLKSRGFKIVPVFATSLGEKGRWVPVFGSVSARTMVIVSWMSGRMDLIRKEKACCQKSARVRQGHHQLSGESDENKSF